MATIYCRQATTPYYTNGVVSGADGTESKPYDYTLSQIITALTNGDTVKLHPTYFIDVMNQNTNSTIICGGSGGVLERWEVPGYEWIMPSFCSLEWIPSAKWVSAGSGNWECTFDGTNGVTLRTAGSTPGFLAWWGIVKGKNDVHKDNVYAGSSRQVANAGELSAPGEFFVDNNSTSRRITVKTDGVNPTALWGSYCVYATNRTSDYWRWTEVNDLTLRWLAFFGAQIAIQPDAVKEIRNVRFEDCYHITRRDPAIYHQPGCRSFNIDIVRPTIDTGWPLVSRPTSISGEAGSVDLIKFVGGNFDNIHVYDLRARAPAHAAVACVPDGSDLDITRGVRVFCTAWDTPSDGYGQRNVIDCGPADYMRGLIMNVRDWYVGKIKIKNQSVQSQLCGSGIYSAQHLPGQSRAYSDFGAGSGATKHNGSNGLSWEGGTVGTAPTAGIDNINVVGAVLDATGNCAAKWFVNGSAQEVGDIKIRSSLIYDAGQSKYAPQVTLAYVNVSYPNVPLFAYATSFSNAYIAPLLHDNVFVKESGGTAIVGCKQASTNYTDSGGGMTTYTIAQIEAFSDAQTDNGGGVWNARNNTLSTTLNAAGYDAQGQWTGTRYRAPRSGASSRGY